MIGKNEFKMYLWTSFLGETNSARLFKNQWCEWLCRFMSCRAITHTKNNRAEEKTASTRTKTEQKRELRNLKCSVLGQNNHGYQMPFVVNRLFSMVRSYTGTNARKRFVSLALRHAKPMVCPRGTSLIIKNWLALWQSGEFNIKLSLRKIDGVLCIIFFVWIKPKLGSWLLSRVRAVRLLRCDSFGAIGETPSKTKEFVLGSQLCSAYTGLFFWFSRTVLFCKLMILFWSCILRGVDIQNSGGCTFNTDPVPC